MLVAALVIVDRPLLDTVLGHRQIDADPPVRPRLRGHHGQLHRVEGGPGVSSGHIGQKIPRLFRQLRSVAAQSPVRIFHRPIQQRPDILL